jgi:hypothetical protein
VSGSSNAAGVPLNAGYQQGQTVNTLRRETDTVALERPSADRRKVIFAWEFRPTTGSASITPGTRQMLAVISIQEPDSETSGVEFVEVSVQVRSYWRRFHTLSQTVAASSGWRVLLTRTPTEAPWERQPDIRALLTHAIDRGLAPKYEDIQWHQVGEQTAVVIVTGKNFFSGTSVVIGGKTLDRPENGLVIKSEKSLQITVPLSALTHEAVLNGRYGPSIELRMDPRGLNPFQIAYGEFLPLSTGQIYVRLSLISATNKPLDINDVKRLPSPLLEINGQFATATLQMFMWPQNNPQVCLCAHVDESFVKVGSGTSVRLTFPFLGKDWSLLFRTYDIRSALCATRMVDGPITRFRFSGGSFSWGPPWSVFLDRVYTPDINGPLKEIGVDLLELEVPTETADKYDQASLIGYYGSAAVRLPRDPSKAPALQGNAKVIVLEAKSQTTVEIEGTELGSIKQVLLGNTTLPFTSASDGSKITVGLFGDALNLTAGKYEFNLVTETNESLKLPLFITPGKGS